MYREFSHVATLEDNAYLEGLLGNPQQEAIDIVEFDSIYHARMIFESSYDWVQ